MGCAPDCSIGAKKLRRPWNPDWNPLVTGLRIDAIRREVTLISASATKVDTGSYPPYDIETVGENQYRITMAVAGFGEGDLDVELRENLLVIKGEKTESGEDEGRYLYKGIAGRSFERRFQLADHVAVTGAKLENGLLHVELKREIPEALKPRRIEIGAGAAKVVDSKAA